VVDTTIALDTARMPNGPHKIQVALIDAGGNRTLSEPATVRVANAGLPNGTGASRFARIESWFDTKGSKHRTEAVVSYRHTRGITGRLLDEHGAPIAGAVLEVNATTDRPAGATRSLGQVITAADGTYHVLPRAGSSRAISVSYRAFGLDASATTSAKLKLQVRAGVSLSVSPRRVSARGTIRFAGRLQSVPGREGTQVVIYAVGSRSRDRIPVTTVRANAAGKFRYRYRFRNSTSGTMYRFRATLHSQANYPFATGSSPVVTVRIR
jgi:hypothetical protein